MKKFAGIALVLLTALWPLASRAQVDGGSTDLFLGTCTPDSYEANNDISTAKPVTEGTIGNLTACDNDENDWYSITVPANAGIVVDIAFLHAHADLDLYLYDAAATGTPVHSSSSTSDNEKVYKMIFATQTNVLIKVLNYDWEDSMWAPYTMTVAIHPGGYDPCAPDDSYEPNDTSATAKPVTAGSPITNLIGCDEDWYSISVPANNGIVVDATFLDDDGNLDLYLYDAAATATSLHSSLSYTDNERVYKELFTTATNVLIRVRQSAYGLPERVSYTLTVALHPGGFDPCAPDDGHEPNDTSATAKPITAGSEVTGLVACDDDWYSLSVPADNGLVVDATFLDDDGNIDLYLYEAGATPTQLHSSTSYTDNERVYAELFDAATNVLIRVRSDGSRSQQAYSLTATLHAGGYDPCSPDDSYEPNDDEAHAAALTVPGTFTSLVGCDSDWYSFSLPAGQGATVDIDFTDDDADLDLYIYEAADTSTAVDSSTGTSDTEEVCADPVSAATDMLIRVRNFSQSSGGTSDYTMTVTLQNTQCSGSSPDGGVVTTDASATDTSGGQDTRNGGTDAASADAGDGGGGGCLCSGARLSGSGALLVLGLALVAVRRRRR
ncbi:MAG: pre-peptidase C-terminal domain-containing protein [Pseudomonadota bacterium]